MAEASRPRPPVSPRAVAGLARRIARRARSELRATGRRPREPTRPLRPAWAPVVTASLLAGPGFVDQGLDVLAALMAWTATAAACWIAADAAGRLRGEIGSDDLRPLPLTAGERARIHVRRGLRAARWWLAAIGAPAVMYVGITVGEELFSDRLARVPLAAAVLLATTIVTWWAAAGAGILLAHVGARLRTEVWKAGAGAALAVVGAVALLTRLATPGPSSSAALDGPIAGATPLGWGPLAAVRWLRGDDPSAWLVVPSILLALSPWLTPRLFGRRDEAAAPAARRPEGEPGGASPSLPGGGLGHQPSRPAAPAEAAASIRARDFLAPRVGPLDGPIERWARAVCRPGERLALEATAPDEGSVDTFLWGVALVVGLLGSGLLALWPGASILVHAVPGVAMALAGLPVFLPYAWRAGGMRSFGRHVVAVEWLLPLAFEDVVSARLKASALRTACFLPLGVPYAVALAWTHGVGAGVGLDYALRGALALIAVGLPLLVAVGFVVPWRQAPDPAWRILLGTGWALTAAAFVGLLALAPWPAVAVGAIPAAVVGYGGLLWLVRRRLPRADLVFDPPE